MIMMLIREPTVFPPADRIRMQQRPHSRRAAHRGSQTPCPRKPTSPVGRAVLAATRAWGEDGVMDLTHHFSVPAPVEEAWKAFNDLERLAPCFPGATINSVDGDEFGGSVKVKLGPISMMY